MPAVPDATRMLFRIGINLGDVIVEDDDLYGDGVNIAARLQAPAAPGGIVISNTVYDQVRNKMSVGFEFLGQSVGQEHRGNRAELCAVRIGGQAGRSPAGSRRARQRLCTQVPRLPPAASPPRRLCALLERPCGRVAASCRRRRARAVAINLITWSGTFWARWPLLVLAAACRARLGESDAPGRARPGVARRDRACLCRHQPVVMERQFLGGLALGLALAAGMVAAPC